MGTRSDEAILRAKYLDWCSARIAERFLALSPDEIYQLAERATHGQTDSVGPLASLSSYSADSDSAFHALVARVTSVLADEMELPTLDEWMAAYSEAPEEFDDEMLGFWKEETSDVDV
jgi:hypothetical protein